MLLDLRLSEKLVLKLLLLLLHRLHLIQLDLELQGVLLLRSDDGKAIVLERMGLRLRLQQHELGLLLGECILERDGGHGNARMFDIVGWVGWEIRELGRRMARIVAAERSGLRWVVCAA